MLRRLAPVLLCVSALLCSAHFSAAGVSLRVDESRSRFFFDDEDKTAGASLLVMNPTAREFAARVFVELLDTEDGVRSKDERVASLRPGTNSVKTELPFSVAASGDADRLPWYRLRYRVAPEGEAVAAAPSEGVVSLSEINPDFFELQVSGPQYTFEGTRYRARVRATHPASHLPVKGVRVSGEAGLDDPDAPLRASATTDEDGYAALDFDLPGSFREDHLDIAVKGRLGGFERSAEDTVSVVRLAEVLVSTDKPIYQPGQTLHVRALVIDTRARRAVADADVVFSVRDPAGTRVFNGTVRTSRFGVASCDWPIAEGTRLGDYFVEADIEGERYDDSSGGQYVRVSRYELPNFAVKVEPDRKFYLPGENAKVSVRADYLFGQPIRRGRVRVVREAERVWNFARQKWDVTEGETFEGETDADGRFIARIDLGKAHSDLGDSGRPARFNDLNYAAYFTDPTTNRTEQRRFDLRVTGEAIHVYVVEPSYDDSQTAGFPLEFYVSTFYADGTPASCAVAVADPRPPVRIARLSSTPLAPALFEVKTNDFGFAKVNRLTLAPRAPEEGEPDDDDVTLRFTARDAKGRTGTASEEFDLAERTVIRVDTDKAIYRAGEPVRARISSNRRELPVAVDVIREQKVVYSTSVRLHGGRASLSIPAGREFRNQLTIAAYALPEAHDDDPDLGTHTVIFPRGRELQFDVRLDKQEYRPGEEASAEVRLRDADGREVEGALGFVVTDRAVDERARTDREFGGSAGGGFSDYVLGTLGAGEGLAGVTRRDLDRLDLSKPLPPGLDLLAEVMLNRSNSFGLNTFGHGFARNQRRMFAAPLAATLRPLGEALDARPVLSGDYPRDEADLRRMLAEGGVRLEDLRDPWGTPFRVWLGTIEGEDVLEVITAAADKRAGTGDDFIALRRGWPYFHHTGAAIERALRRHHARTGALIKDRAALRRELLAEGIDFGALRDRWGRPYELQTETNRSDFILRVQSAGPDTRFGARHAADDFTISTARVNYFERVRQLVNAALDGAIGRGDSFPADEAALRALLSREGVDERLLLDPWGRPYRLVFGERAWMSGRFVIRSYARHGEQPKDKAVDAGPVTLRLHSFAVYSLGPDGQDGTYDDFHLGSFARVLDQTNAPPQPTLRQTVSFQSGANAGTLNGVVTDANGAVIANAAVHATHAGTGAVRTATANEDGAFVLEGLAAGIYEVRFEAAGFKIALITGVVVKAGEVTTMDVILEPGAVTEAVTVTAEAMVLESTSASTVDKRQIQNLPLNGR
ncbi:MAG TPA: MG2 domain-containing protein, partial [Pyrinomonadaceae bacterium]|nr:MG2 domain-containing protein [Pyrinomonadaceae bacterium]